MLSEVAGLHETQYIEDLNIFDLDKDIWDDYAEKFYKDYACKMNRVFWRSWREQHSHSWRKMFLQKLHGHYAESDVFMLLDES